MINSIKTLIPKTERDYVYDVLGHMAPKLCVDIGAAAGHMTRIMRAAGTDDAEVVAFEPFPGNYEFFKQEVAGLTNIKLIKKAVSDRCGDAEFIVPSSVQGEETGWEDLKGYSSVGFLGNTFRIKSLIYKILIRLNISSFRSPVSPGSSVIRVETTTIDRELPGRQIDFMKIDVQGGEYNVLLGSRTQLEKDRVGIMYLEWTGDERVLHLLNKHGYEIYDTSYTGTLGEGSREKLERLGFRVIGDVPLSTGALVYEMEFCGDRNKLVSILQKINRYHAGFVQTDLIAVSRSYKDRFEKAAAAYSETD